MYVSGCSARQAAQVVVVAGSGESAAPASLPTMARPATCHQYVCVSQSNITRSLS